MEPWPISNEFSNRPKTPRSDSADEACEDIDTARGLPSVDSFLIDEQRGFIQAGIGIACLHGGRFDEAIEAFTVAHENAADAHIYFERARAYRYKGEYDLSAADFEQALSLKPEDQDYLLQRAFMWENAGEADKAIADYSRIIEVNPKSLKEWYSRGFSLCRLGRHGEAIPDLTRSIEIDSTFYEGYLELGSAYARVGRLEEAMSTYSKAIEIQPSNPDAYLRRGGCVDKEGRRTEGRRGFQQGQGPRSGRPSGLNRLGSARVPRQNDPRSFLMSAECSEVA